MKKILLPIFLTSFLIVCAFFVFVVWTIAVSPVSNSSEAKIFVVEKGDSASLIAQKLQSQGLIRSALAMKIYLKLTNGGSKLQSGEFKIYKSQSLTKVLTTLFGAPLEVWVTIPEGFRREQIAQKIVESLDLKGDGATLFVKQFLSASTGREGYLFPDTYLFPPDVSADAVVGKMTSTFDQKFEASLRTKALESGLDLNSVVTLASLVERETRGNEEKPVVAGIILKREKAGWALQIDATVQYIVASENCGTNIDCEWWPAVSGNDLNINSLFNTYKYPGFPLSPIANPGIESLKAASDPRISDYWYYLHDNKGEIHYAKTLEEHEQNVRIYLSP